MSKTSIEFDRQQRELALDITKSFIVQAPAGSGKTELLIQRYLALLSQVSRPDEIIAVTFTKKAANEMRTRVIAALRTADANQLPTSEHQLKTYQLALQALKQDQLHQWHLIQNPNQLRIQTLDSLCAYLTKQLPLLSHFGAQPEIAPDPTYLYRIAIDEVLNHVEKNFAWSKAIAKLLLHLDNDLNKLQNLMINLLSKRDQWLPYLHLHDDDITLRKKLESYLKNVINEALFSLDQLLPDEDKRCLLEVARYSALNCPAPHPMHVCLNLDSFPSTDAMNLPIWRSIATLLLTKSLGWRKRFTADIGFKSIKELKSAQEKNSQQHVKSLLSSLVEKYSEDEAMLKAFSELFLLPNAHYENYQWDILEALLQVLRITAAQLRLVFQTQGKIDFIENLTGALFALGTPEDPTDLTLALDYRISHILVDEFQDTSFSQYYLLERLTMGWESQDGRTLFVVGDPMQSIYRFREAEVGLYIRMTQHGINQIKLIPLRLSVNFRSYRPIVEWNNQHFQELFPATDDITNGAVSYNSSLSIAEHKNAQSIFMQGLINADQTLQAQQVVDTVQSLQRAYPKDTITILVRSRTHLSEIIKRLKSNQIEYSAVEIDVLYHRSHIQDVLALTIALLHPYDRISWLAILRAPWCGLTLADLHIIAAQHPSSSIWDRMNQKSVIAQLSAEGQTRIHSLLPILTHRLRNRSRDNMRVYIESAWLALGGPATLKDANDYLDVESYFQLLASLNSSMVITKELLHTKLEKLYAPSPKQTAQVQIMTIHTAKGLEFDHVILPHLEKKPRHNDARLLLWMERPLRNQQNALLLAPIHATGETKDSIYSYVAEKNKIKDQFEMNRVLYVATTRAKKSLHFLFSIQEDKKGELQPEANSFLAKLWPSIKNDPMLSLIKLSQNKEIEVALTQPNLLRLNQSWTNPTSHVHAETFSFHQQESGITIPNHTPRIIGTLTHMILYRLSISGIDWWKQSSAMKKQQFIKKLLSQFGLPNCDIEIALHTIQRAINHTLDDARGQWILKKHTQANSEYTLSLYRHKKVFRYIIDRTFIDENDIRWIIDYKTTVQNQHDLQLFLKQEQKKYTEKMQAYAETLYKLDARTIKCALYFPSIPAWHQWDFEPRS